MTEKVLPISAPKHIKMLEGGLYAWTVFTTTFLWTPSMRLLLKPEISQWRIFGVGGQGAEGPNWLLPLLALAALAMFYLGGRWRTRNVYFAMMLAWHGGVCIALTVGFLASGGAATFEGAAWGIRLSMAVLAIPFALSTAATVAAILQDRQHRIAIPPSGWLELHWPKIGIAALLLPVAAILFRVGHGYDMYTLAAIVVTIIQWILLVESVGPPVPGSGAHQAS